MTLQSTVNADIGFGIIGEAYLDGPKRAQPGIIDSAGPNTVGFAFTKVPGADGHCIVGGALANDAPFFGILGNPKNYPLYGTTGNPFAPSLNVPQNTIGEFYQQHPGLIVALGPCKVGDLVDYIVATGALVVRPAANAFTGIIAVTTGILTVSAFVAGGAPIRVGSVISGGTTPPGTYVTGLGTGAGGNGTYNTNIITAVASAAMSTTSVPAAGNARVPGGEVTRYDNSVNGGPAVIKFG